MNDCTVVWLAPAAIGCAPKQLAGSNTNATRVLGDSVEVSTVDEVTSPVSTILNAKPEPGLNENRGVGENGVQLRKTGLIPISISGRRDRTSARRDSFGRKATPARLCLKAPRCADCLKLHRLQTRTLNAPPQLMA
jgi:hypothetical protein